MKRERIEAQHKRTERPDQTIPFIKWAGGKQWLASQLAERLNGFSGRYFEPFLGGGALFFALRPRRAYLSDKNADLITTFRVVQNDVARLIKKLTQFKFSEDCYYETREARPRSAVGIAARFIYLNRTAWNGLYRVNRNGCFNVPIGEFAREPDIVRADLLRTASIALKGATLCALDFEAACRSVGAGDLVYLDPPYTVTHNNNGFLRYNDSIFSWADQKRLASLVRRLDSVGAIVVVSNAAHKAVEGLYGGFHVMKIDRISRLAADATKRRKVSECLISNSKLLRVFER